MSADNQRALQHLVQLACASVSAEHAELVVGDEGVVLFTTSTDPSRRPVDAPASFFDEVRVGNIADFASMHDDRASIDSGVGSLVSVPVTGPSAEPGWLVATHSDLDAFDSDSVELLFTAVELIEDRLDRAVERIRLDQLSEVLRSNQTALQATREKLEISNTELEQFAYIAAHELLAPLRSVVVYAELLDSSLASLDADQVNSCATEIRRGVALMDQQLRHLLELSSTQQDAADPIPVDLDEVVRGAIDGLADQLESAHASIELGALPVVAGRPVLLRSVFSNLISNAVKYQRPGTDPVITITSSQDAEGTHVAVQDNGPGIDDESQSRVFTLFERASTDTPGSGIGLGLSRRIVEAFGGTIAYRPGETGGSVFVLTFPPVASAA